MGEVPALQVTIPQAPNKFSLPVDALSINQGVTCLEQRTQEGNSAAAASSRADPCLTVTTYKYSQIKGLAYQESGTHIIKPQMNHSDSFFICTFFMLTGIQYRGINAGVSSL